MIGTIQAIVQFVLGLVLGFAGVWLAAYLYFVYPHAGMTSLKWLWIGLGSGTAAGVLALGGIAWYVASRSTI